ncbi:MAG TPA: Lpg1974 family pore-forming outer membrane protein [Rhabdochlamydiaceae bacterium]|nr:Lpg1974 family pore-forming outer membrane protein [Rhabdochlamydiaceae bacterium]
MRQKEFSLLLLSCAFFGTLYSDSTYTDFNDEKRQSYLDYEEEDDFLDDEDLSFPEPQKPDKKLSQNQQNAMKPAPQIQGNQNDPSCCPPIIEDCCTCNICPPTEMITPPAGPCVMYGWGVYLTGDFIYWSARERETAIAATTGFANSFQVGVPSTKSGEVIRFDETYKPGFKAGLGLDFCHDGWDLFAEYTWFRLTTTKSASAPTLPNTQQITSPFEGLTLWDAYWGINGSRDVIGQNISFAGGVTSLPQAQVYGKASGKWHLGFNVVDLELARNFYISRRLMLRPHVGLKGTWQKQTFSIALTEGITNMTTGLVFETAADGFMKQRLTDWGVGPRIGLDTSWHFNRAFSLFGDIAFTGLYERFNVKRFDYSLFPHPSTLFNLSNSFIHLKSQFTTIEPVIEWMLGLRLENWFLCDRYHVALEAAWEEQVWFGQNQFLRNHVLESPEGTLVLSGLTVQVRFDF